MAGLRDMFRRSFGGRQPEEALMDFKEKLHVQINAFKDDPENQARLQSTMRSIITPLQYFNSLMVRPNMDDNQKMRELAKKYGINKVELKRVFKVALEFEEKVQNYFKNRGEVEQLVITLRKVVNVLDEQILTDIIDAMDYNVDYGKIEKAYLDYQSTLQKAYNSEGLNRDLQGIMGGLISNFKNAFQTSAQAPKTKASDKHAEVRMMEPELQSLYDHYREEGFEHDESMKMINEKKDLDALPRKFLEAYRTLRQEGHSHTEAIEYVRDLANKSGTQDSDT